MSARLALASTMREPGEQALQSWLRYHLAIGVDHVFLFFDDPQDPCQEVARAFPDVTVILNNDALRARYATLSNYPRFARQSNTFHYARQMLNMELATQLAQAGGYRWLSHIDDDELIFTPSMSIVPQFERFTRERVHQILFVNHEALPTTWDVGDRFREVQYFKINPWQVPSHLRAEVETFWMQGRGYFFAGYDNGKPAVRLQPGLTAKGVHRFSRIAGEIPSEPASDIFLLHYANCGYRAFRRKYEMWGNFPDTWPDGSPITTGFHMQCRQALASGDEAAFRRLYEAHVMVASGADLDRQLALGLVFHNPQPADLLDRLQNRL